MNFSIDKWQAISPYHRNVDDWKAWLSHKAPIRDNTPAAFDLSFLPAMQRRRLSPSARLLFAAAWSLLEDEHCPIVYVSYDGEVNRSFELWLSLLKDSAVSPTSFALSVHNAVVGQWSLLRGDMSESVALSASANALELGIVEACALLAEDHPKVLVVVVDNPIKQAYNVSVKRAPFDYALALTLIKGSSWRLTLNTEDNTKTDDGSMKYYDSALNWIEQQLTLPFNEPLSWQSKANVGYWLWERKGYSCANN